MSSSVLEHLWYSPRIPCNGSSDDQFIRGGLGWRGDMKKAGSEKKEPAPAVPKAAVLTTREAPAKADAPDPEAQKQHHQDRLHLPHLKKCGWHCRQYCALIIYILLGILTILISLGVIVVTSFASVATKIYDTDQSGRLMAMIILAVTAAVTLSMIIYAEIGTFKQSSKHLHAAGIVLAIIAVIQALIIAVAINVTAADELSIGKSLSESFKLAIQDQPRHVKLWAATQSDLQCCGVYGPADYQDKSTPYYFPPNVPISCCSSYDVSKAPHSQERQRELCKVNATYFGKGCKGLVVQVFKGTSSLVIGIIVVLIVFELLLTILGSYLSKKAKEHNCEENQHEKEPVSAKK